MSTDVGEAVFIINDTKLYVPVVTLSKEDNKGFIEQKNKGFQRSVYWNQYKTKEINENADANVFKYINLDPSFQGVNRLFVMEYNRTNGQSTRNGRIKYYLPRIDLEKYNVIIDGRNFYDNPIESDIEKYRELKKVMIGKGEEDHTTGSLFKDKKVLIVFDDMIADIEYNKNFKQIIKELFYRARKINVSIVFITQSYFRALKDARLNSTHYIIMKINNKKELKRIAEEKSGHSDYKDYLKMYNYCTEEPFSFMTIDARPIATIPFKKNFNHLINL